MRTPVRHSDVCHNSITNLQECQKIEFLTFQPIWPKINPEDDAWHKYRFLYVNESCLNFPQTCGLSPRDYPKIYRLIGPATLSKVSKKAKTPQWNMVEYVVWAFGPEVPNLMSDLTSNTVWRPKLDFLLWQLLINFPEVLIWFYPITISPISPIHFFN